jgi:phage terminase large subunit-like protein
MLTPTRFTPPLKEDFTSLADKFLPLIRTAWKVAFGKDYEFDEWQVDLIRRILETDAQGDLRYRQCFVSLPRQQGKSELMAVIGLIALLRKDGVTNLGVASTADQARLVHERLLRVVQANPALSKIMSKITDTRGIVTKTGSKYIIRASNAATLQGIPVTTAIVDELHLVEESVYSAVVAGTGARKGTAVYGITTAGDNDSELLKNLYEKAEKAINGDLKGFGAFIWEASESRVPDSDEELLQLLMECNPALESGRLDPDIMLQDVRTMPDQDVIRYRLNRFVDSEDKTFVPLSLWQAAGRGSMEEFPKGTRPVFAVDRSPDWGYATIIAAAKDKEGIIHTEVVASLVKPNLEQLVKLCSNLASHGPAFFVMDGYSLKELGNELKRRGLPTFVTNQPEVINASSLFYAKVAQKKLRHGNDPLLTIQMPRTGRKQVGDAFRVSRKDSSVEIDAVMATVLGVYVAENQQERPVGIW